MLGKILLVEDDFYIALCNEEILKNIGYEVIAIIDSGEEAIKKALELKPDLILTDINLASEMTGIEAIKKIKEFLNIPFIYISGSMDPEVIEEANETKPFTFLRKPVDYDTLQTAVTSALKN